MKMTEGKLKGLEALSNDRGVIAAAAMDQRGSLRKSLAKAKGVEDKQITDAMMQEFKTLVTKVLTPHATAILLDPEFGLPAVKARSKNAGVLLAYENSGYDNTKPGRLPDLLEVETVRSLQEAGADAIKILLYYTPFDPKPINDHKHAWTERIGAECADRDIPFFFEFVGYDPAGGDVNTLEYAKQKPEIVAKSMEEFSKAKYQIDVLKVEMPINMKFVEGTKSFKGQKAYSKAEAVASFKKTAQVTKKPFIYLSAGVDDDEFRESLELAAESGVRYNGVLCGRATWKNGIPVYAKEGAKAFEAWLLDQGVKNIKALNAVLDKSATGWYDVYGGRDKVQAVGKTLETARA
ncbi:MAG TPA: tagatose 1,6-diphosphate aldolase [Verrucomicrobiae bacterium]|jgi:tagatose 1,6-diphosphate aldolase|nr:tagatose 1,6-diphosphate aldolase [Verrucomicrobiae bacterium]